MLSQIYQGSLIRIMCVKNLASALENQAQKCFKFIKLNLTSFKTIVLLIGLGTSINQTFGQAQINESIKNFYLFGNQLYYHSHFYYQLGKIAPNGIFDADFDFNTVDREKIVNEENINGAITTENFQVVQIDSICQITINDHMITGWSLSDSLYTNFYKLKIRVDSTVIDLFINSLSSKEVLSQEIQKNKVFVECCKIHFKHKTCYLFTYYYYTRKLKDEGFFFQVETLTYVLKD